MTQHHILAPFHLVGGGVWHAIDFATSLRKSGSGKVHLWSPKPVAELLAGYPITTIAPYSGATPDGGHLWVIGPDTDIGHWYESCRFEQVTLVYNQHAPDLFYQCMHKLTTALQREASVSYASSALAKEIGIPGTVTPPSFDSDRFFDASLRNEQSAGQVFTVGRASRDVQYKHHMDDPDLYASLLQQGCQIELVGATCIANRLPKHPLLKARPEMPQPELPKFLHRLDCFVYRTSPRKPEGFGLSIVEAMAAGLPVVAAKCGGYADIIKSGENGFLFETNEEALAHTIKLKTNPDLREQIGIAAKKTIGSLFVR